MQSLWLIIVVFFLILLVVPLFAKLHISYDFLHNIGSLSIYLFFIKIVAFKMRLNGKNIVLISYNKEKELESAVSQGQIRFIKQLNSQLKQKIVVRKITAMARIGCSDAAISACASGLFNALVYSTLAYIKNIKKSAQMSVISEPDYNGKHLTMALYLSFAITIVDIIYALVMSIAITKRSEKYEKL